MKEKFFLSDEILFDIKPIAVPYSYRISYKIPLIILILSLCCNRGGCSLIKPHLIVTSLSTNEEMKRLIDLVQYGSREGIVIKFDPSINRALMYGIAEGVFEQQKDGKIKLSLLGKKYQNAIMSDDKLLVREKKLLIYLSTKVTEKLIKEIKEQWRYTDVTNK